jgi:hypothetical protein
VPCPTKYTDNEAANDYARLLQFSSLRESERPLSEMQEAEEAHRRVRFDVFAHSPEQVFRRRLMVLEEVERRSQKSRVFKESLAPRFSAKDQKSLSGYDGFTRSRAEASFGITAASLECRKVGRSMNCPITTRSRTNGHL